MGQSLNQNEDSTFKRSTFSAWKGGKRSELTQVPTYMDQHLNFDLTCPIQTLSFQMC